jgi:hypothetical protein
MKTNRKKMLRTTAVRRLGVGESTRAANRIVSCVQYQVKLMLHACALIWKYLYPLHPVVGEDWVRANPLFMRCSHCTHLSPVEMLKPEEYKVIRTNSGYVLAITCLFFRLNLRVKL